MKKCLVCSVGKDGNGDLIVYNIIECEYVNSSTYLCCYVGNHGFIVYDNNIIECKNITSKEAYSLAKKLKMIL